MKIKLSEHFTYHKLLRFVFPSIVMMIFTSIYGVVDGLLCPIMPERQRLPQSTFFCFVSPPPPLLWWAPAGNPLRQNTLGGGRKKKPHQSFSLILIKIIVGAALNNLWNFLARPVSLALAVAPPETFLDYCTLYGRITFLSLTLFMLQNVFQCFLSRRKNQNLVLLVVVLAGVTNMVLDYLFIAVFGMGLVGAAIATVCGECIGGFCTINLFCCQKFKSVSLRKNQMVSFYPEKTCANGSSELMTNLSSSIVNTLFNFQLMRFVGENGVAAYGTIMYVNFIFVAIYFGYSIGSAPIVSYHYGAQNHKELKNLLNKSLRFTGICGIFMFILPS